ncbi:hypothetical protein IFVP408_C2210005 [Vibrio parahaemolyticus]
MSDVARLRMHEQSDDSTNQKSENNRKAKEILTIATYLTTRR